MNRSNIWVSAVVALLLCLSVAVFARSGDPVLLAENHNAFAFILP
jgi:hypothetical protein